MPFDFEEQTPGFWGGWLLVATRRLVGETFRRTVILMLEHSDEGALGVVLNRPTPLPVSSVLPEGWQDLVDRPGHVFRGGPVSPDTALGLATLPPSGPVPSVVRQVISPFALIDLGAEPEQIVGDLARVRVFAGYAGWGPGQLESEIEEGSWYTFDALPSDPFSDRPDQLWTEVMRRQGGDLALLSIGPDDPSLN